MLHLIAMAVQAGRQHNVGVNVCGEMSGEPMCVPLLVGPAGRAGPRTTSRRSRKVIRSATIAEAKQVARDVMPTETAPEVNRATCGSRSCRPGPAVSKRSERASRRACPGGDEPRRSLPEKHRKKTAPRPAPPPDSRPRGAPSPNGPTAVGMD